MFTPRCLLTNFYLNGRVVFSCWLKFFSYSCPEFKHRFTVILWTINYLIFLVELLMRRQHFLSFLIALQCKDGCKNKKWQFVKSLMKMADFFTLHLQTKLWNDVAVLHVHKINTPSVCLQWESRSCKMVHHMCHKWLPGIDASLMSTDAYSEEIWGTVHWNMFTNSSDRLSVGLCFEQTKTKMRDFHEDDTCRKRK